MSTPDQGPITITGMAYCYVVLGPGHPGAGKIKRIPLAENIQTSLVEYKNGIARISTGEERSGKGSVFLADMWIAEGKPERFAVYEQWVAACAEGRANGEFPDALMPAQLIAWRSARATATETFDPIAAAAAAESPTARIEPVEDPAPASPRSTIVGQRSIEGGL